MRKNLVEISALVLIGLSLWYGLATAQDVAGDADSSAAADATASDASPQPQQSTSAEGRASHPAAPPKLPEPQGARRLSPDYDVWIDPKKGVVMIDGLISLREGMLEMFACTRNTKEHESIVSANTRAYIVHAALMALGAEPGHPAQFVPSYQPPTGTEIDVMVHWLDAAGKPKEIRAQEWIKDINTGKAMSHPWVFGGSRFWTDPETGKRYYQAEGGDFICVSNFGTAMIDIPIESSRSNEELAFQTFSERIPPLGTPVRLVLKPKLERPGAGSKEPEVKNSDAAARPAADEPSR
jgi:hypothetical protein